MTPAEELRTAAQTLRTARFPGAMTSTRTAAAIISARLPLADWLETTAIRLDHSTHPSWQENVEPKALAVARTINAGGQP